MKHLSLKFALFGALFFLPTLLSGCYYFWGRCKCEDDPETYFKIKSMQGDAYFKDYNNALLSYNKVGISMQASVDYYANAKRKEHMTLGGSFLYATEPCDCYKGTKGAKEKVKSLTIKSNAVYINNYLAGIDLAPLMSITGNGFPLNNELQSPQKVESFLSKNYFTPMGFVLMFDSPPTQDKKHIFTIRYELDNGEVYTYTTPEITFQ